MIQIPEGALAHFASDLHLSEKTPKTLAAFEHWLASVSQPDHLIFLLGDVFEVWYGDDYEDEVTQRVCSALQKASLTGAHLFFMRGNRDFLVGHDLATQCGFEILEDPDFLQVNGQVVLISHGDTLCTDDIAYQAFRTQSRHEGWQAQFLSQPLAQRIQIAKAIREKSIDHKSNTALNIMDVNSQAVQQTFEGTWPDGCYIGRNQVIIHGHTHRCAVHAPSSPSLNKNDGSAPSGTTKVQSTHGHLEAGLRIVLPDWDFDTPSPTQAKGGYLSLTPEGDYSLNLFSAA